MPRARYSRIGLLALALLAAGCGSAGDGTVEVALIGRPADVHADGLRIGYGAQLVRAATTQGLVGLDEQGEVIPALADRWIVTDDGRSYIFRLREGQWPDGKELSGESARDALRRTINALAGTALGLDLAPVADIRAMAGRVLEVRLSSPQPSFLQLLAQPELALTRVSGMGPMVMERDGGTALFTWLPPEARGLPQVQDWASRVRPVRTHALPADKAVERFYAGQLDFVLGGQFEDFPLVDTGPLSRGTARLDPAIGLFGLQVVEARGFLADNYEREALALAIDRQALVARLNVGGWNPTSRVVASDLPGDSGSISPRWEGLGMDERRAEAARRVAAWRSARGVAAAPVLRIALPQGPGSDLLFERLATDFQAIGLTVRRVGTNADADLRLVDRVARYPAPQWFLNQFNCRLTRGICSREADTIMAEARRETDPSVLSELLAEAEVELTTANVFIPIGPPLRWSLVRGGTSGFAGNLQAFHPLPPLAIVPN
jgi:oligopeptide transport system substrate-binding protein